VRWSWIVLLAACADQPPGCPTACDTPPGPTCASQAVITYGSGACVDGECTYAMTSTPCLSSEGYTCQGGRCIHPTPVRESVAP
jgi:hypothetical protein